MNWTKYLPCLLILGMGSGCSSEVKHPGENQDLCLTDSLLKIVSIDTVHLHDVADELTLNGRVLLIRNRWHTSIRCLAEQ